MLNSSHCCEGSVLTEDNLYYFRKVKVKLQMHASVSEICLSLKLSVKVRGCVILLSRRLVQKSRLKMWPVDTSEMSWTLYSTSSACRWPPMRSGGICSSTSSACSEGSLTLSSPSSACRWPSLCSGFSLTCSSPSSTCSSVLCWTLSLPFSACSWSP